jgi:FkbM family methyltransferase
MKFRDAARLVLSPRELQARRELERVRKQPRHTPGRTTLFGRPLEYVDSSSYFFLHEEIFKQEVYDFRTESACPRIIDGGANIGLSVIYFKRRYPGARITAFEADPHVAGVLGKNLAAHGLTDVDIRAEALWSSDTELAFLSDGADGGRVVPSNKGEIRIPAVALSSFLDEPVDFLKLDIEGAECEVLQSCRGRLGNVEKAFVEYHSRAGEPQQLPDLLALLRDEGFRCFVTAPSVFSPKPLQETGSYAGFDMVLNIFAVRPQMQARAD